MYIKRKVEYLKEKELFRIVFTPCRNDYWYYRLSRDFHAKLINHFDYDYDDNSYQIFTDSIEDITKYTDIIVNIVVDEIDHIKAKNAICNDLTTEIKIEEG